MGNSHISLAKEYHESTKHSQNNIREVVSLDFENRPLPYKEYTTLTPIKLPTSYRHPMEDTIHCVVSLSGTGGDIDSETFAELLYFSAGITKTLRSPTGEVYDLRAAACTGARYEIETYVVCGDLPPLASGVYHFNPRDFALRKLRAGDFRRFLYETTGEDEQVLSSPMSLILSAIHWRNSWKYQARAYRHFYWDSGTIIANLLATSISIGLGTKVILGFIDESVNHLLGLNMREETATAIVTLGTQPNAIDSSHRPLGPIPALSFEYVPLSKKRTEYSEILEMHNASVLNSPQEIKTWREPLTPNPESRPGVRSFPLRPIDSRNPNPLGRTIIRRGSTRRYAREPIPLSYLSTILESSTVGILADFLNPKGSTLLESYIIINAVDGLPAGAYYYNRAAQTLELLKLGDFRDTAGYLCLEQALGTDCSAVAFLMSSLDSILSTYGNRGYAAAQLEAGIMLGKMNLCAYALGIGASGITFYDDAITDFFSPHAAGKSNMISVTLGIPAYGGMHAAK